MATRPSIGMVAVRAVGESEGGASQTTNTVGDQPGGDGKKMANTLSALDALLGVEPEPPKEEETKVRWQVGRVEARGPGRPGNVSNSP